MYLQVGGAIMVGLCSLPTYSWLIQNKTFSAPVPKGLSSS